MGLQARGRGTRRRKRKNKAFWNFHFWFCELFGFFRTKWGARAVRVEWRDTAGWPFGRQRGDTPRRGT